MYRDERLDNSYSDGSVDNSYSVDTSYNDGSVWTSNGGYIEIKRIQVKIIGCLVGFLIPILGIILYIACKNDDRSVAGAILYSSILSILLGIMCILLYTVCIMRVASVVGI